MNIRWKKFWPETDIGIFMMENDIIDSRKAIMNTAQLVGFEMVYAESMSCWIAWR
jgi:hypothetical protein